ncbi:calcium-binding protein [Humisphaera borealis]|uniref:Calcium-binding protein n=1 Tax=Humisphaera borealis TaxID=2807512 RepID=A0A7M2WQE2_9BACT|nr:calcium-binding protein [Humisphaera borealis]QOV87666.1 hypothetical protein IPV69_15380 [Humisphaera borealis]
MSQPTLSATVESLESRRLMSASPVFVAGGTLFVFGRGNAENSVVVSRSTDDKIAVSFDASVPGVSAVRSFSQLFDAADVQNVIVRGGRLNDTIEVGKLDAGWTIPVFVQAGAGNDTVWTGAGNDVIFGADGDDDIDAGDGLNLVNGGKGLDTIVTGSGNDLIAGGNDRDTIHSGAGDDLVRAGDGDDDVTLGDGNDRASGQLGNDVIRGEGGNDNLWGGRGDDVIYGGDGDDLLGGVFDYNSLYGQAGQDTFVMVDPDANSHDFNDLEDIMRLTKKKSDGDVVETV